MHIAKSIEDVRIYIKKAREEKKKIGFVPTMGYLHQGHLSLVEISKQHVDYHVMSIFVNKIQFNDAKDFDSYPKDLERDINLAEEVGVDLVFIPDDDEMYQDNLTYVDVEGLTDNLCGAHRPGHFKGVFTVVSKLFNIIQPDISIFGQKDIQQAVSIEKMVKDLNFPVEIIIAPIAREDDGLAMSSRNKHLSAEQRTHSLAIYRSLKKAEELLLAGERKTETIAAAMKSALKEGKPDRIDYISVVRYTDLSFTADITGKTVIAVAAFFGSTRLIDNMIIEVTPKVRCIF